MKTKLTVVAAIAVALTFTACKKTAGPEGPQGAAGASGPVLTGNLKGYISHYDLSGVKIQSGLSGDTVKIDGTGNIAITDANGLYTFAGLTTGNYNLSINKPLFGSTKIQSIAFSGGSDLYRNANICKIPTTNVTAFVATATVVSSINYINFSGTITAAPYAQAVVVYVGNQGSTNVSATSGSNITYYTINVAANATSFSKNIPTYEFYDVNYASGNVAYFAAYMIGANFNASSYNDLTNNRTVFTAISPAPITTSVTLQ